MKIDNQNLLIASKKLAQKKRLFSIKEVVDFFGASEWFWRTQIWDGALPYVQVGKKILLDGRDIEIFINNNKKSNI